MAVIVFAYIENTYLLTSSITQVCPIVAMRITLRSIICSAVLLLLCTACEDHRDPQPGFYTAVPDVIFEKFLIFLQIDDVQDGRILTSSAQKLTTMDVRNRGMRTLAGIEAFTNLELFACDGNNLTELDVSKNTALIRLECDRNNLTKLDVSKNTRLAGLYCAQNSLTELDVSKNTHLFNLSCSSNRLTTLDLSKNPLLETLSCGDNSLSTLSVTNMPNLYRLDCENNKLTALDLSKNPILRSLTATGNAIPTICVGGQSRRFWNKDATTTYAVCP